MPDFSTECQPEPPENTEARTNLAKVSVERYASHHDVHTLCAESRALNHNLSTSHRTRPLASERQREITRLVRESGALRIGELTEMFQVSDETIRRDLSLLEDQGVLTREHGGAIADGVGVETTYQRRMRERQSEKDEIAHAAAAMVRDGSTIIIDSGTTMMHLVGCLRSKRDLVVITNGISHAEELLKNPTLTLVVTGGVVRRSTLGAAGQLAVVALNELHADHTFIATHGFSAEAGLMYPSFEEVAVKQAMIAAGAEVTLLADGSKCGRAGMVRVAPMTQIDRVITTPPMPDDERRKLAQLGVDVVVVGSGSVGAADGSEAHGATSGE